MTPVPAPVPAATELHGGGCRETMKFAKRMGAEALELSGDSGDDVPLCVRNNSPLRILGSNPTRETLPKSTPRQPPYWFTSNVTRTSLLLTPSACPTNDSRRA